jgi:hypothetical protein
MPLDRETLQRFVALAGDRLEGDWVVIGGTVLPLLGVEHRVTVDIDVAGPAEAGMDQTLALLRIAEEIGLPVEAVNQAGALFLHRIRGWQSRLVEIHRGRQARILVPDATLFVLLKAGRLTEADLSDCLAMLELARTRGERVDLPRLRRTIGKGMAAANAPEKERRMRTLLEALDAPRDGTERTV